MLLFLTRGYIPTVIRLRIIRSVLVPIAIYGCELYEISSTRLSPIQRVFDRVARDILGCSSNHSRKANYDELSIPTLGLRGAMLRAQVATKWVNSRTVIGIFFIPHTSTHAAPGWQGAENGRECSYIHSQPGPINSGLDIFCNNYTIYHYWYDIDQPL